MGFWVSSTRRCHQYKAGLVTCISVRTRINVEPCRSGAGDYRDPVADLPGAGAEQYGGSRMVTFAPMAGTGFVVIVQRR